MTQSRQPVGPPRQQRPQDPVAHVQEFKLFSQYWFDPLGQGQFLESPVAPTVVDPVALLHSVFISNCNCERKTIHKFGQLNYNSFVQLAGYTWTNGGGDRVTGTDWQQ